MTSIVIMETLGGAREGIRVELSDDASCVTGSEYVVDGGIGSSDRRGGDSGRDGLHSQSTVEWSGRGFRGSPFRGRVGDMSPCFGDQRLPTANADLACLPRRGG
jgi:hypothetical protein